MEVTSEYVHACMVRWGLWVRDGGRGIVGYPAMTAEGRLRRDGTLTRAPGPRPLTDDRQSEEIDGIVGRLRPDNELWPRMVEFYYVGGDDMTYARVAEALARQGGRSVRAETVRRWMREAMATIRGELRGMHSTA